MSETNTNATIIETALGEHCFGYRPHSGGVCSVLRDSTAGAYRELGFCNTIECPFYKPRSIAHLAAHVGNNFVPYTKEQIRIADSFRKSSKPSIKF